VFLISRVEDSTKALASYRTALRDAFDPGSFAMFYADEIGSRLGNDVNESVDFTQLLHNVLESCRQHGANLRRLLVSALRHRAGRAALVEVLAPALGLEPVVAVADLLARSDCPASLRTQVALAIDDTKSAHRTALHAAGREAWLDVLVWLEELPEGVRSRPPLIDYLERIEYAWRDANAAGSAELGRWLATQRNAHGIGRRSAELGTRLARGVLIELKDVGTVWTWVAYVFGDDSPTKLDGGDFKAPSGAQGLCDAIGRVVEGCLAHRTIAPLQRSGVELRFELVLPNPWIWVPVDQILIGGNESDDIWPTRLGASHPVVVRPQSWWRPTPGVASSELMLRRFKTKRDHLRGGGAAEVRTLDCPSRWTADYIEIINESPEVVGIALACDHGTTVSPAHLARCVRAHVLAIVWKRSGAADTTRCAQLEALLTPIEQAPKMVHKQRLKLREDLSLIWHLDPVGPPDLIPLGEPEIG
jgi:hypothetical protein